MCVVANYDDVKATMMIHDSILVTFSFPVRSKHAVQFDSHYVYRELNKMLDAVQRFARDSVELRGNDKYYQMKDKHICYVDPVSGVPVDSISYGYVTAFTYFLENKLDPTKLTNEDLRARVKLQPDCGTLSYSLIPTFYTYRLGMSGTLDCECLIPDTCTRAHL